jgi:hypothetical protein
MAHLSCAQRLIVIKIFSSLKISRIGNIGHRTKQISRDCYGITINLASILRLVNKWKLTGGVQDRIRAKLHKRFITDHGLLAIFEKSIQACSLN